MLLQYKIKIFITLQEENGNWESEKKFIPIDLQA